MKHCPTCGEWKPLSEFYRSSRTPDGLKSQCKKCHSESSRRTRNKDNARRINREYMRRARARNPEKYRARERAYARPHDEKYKARVILNSAVRSGIIIRPDQCSRCGKAGRITAHHSDYSKPLDVEWLCYECHGEAAS